MPQRTIIREFFCDTKVTCQLKCIPLVIEELPDDDDDDDDDVLWPRNM